jgi:hypothetical protein
MSKFSKDEQYTLMSLWCIFRSPLMFGGDLPSNDPFTLSLINNKEVLYILQKSTNNRELFRDGNNIAWVADDPDTGDKFVALFNAGDEANAVRIPVDLKQLGFNGNCKVRDLWRKTNIGVTKDKFAPLINKHGAGLYRLSKN